MRALFRQEALEEALEAQAWHEDRAPGLGLEFARAVDAAVAAIRRHPQAFPRIESDFRRVLLRRFPYALIYLVEDDAIVILACFHHARRPRTPREHD